MENIVEELRRPVRLDESFERRVMVQVRRVVAERRKERGWLGAAASLAQRPAWAAAMAAGLVAVVTFGVFRVRQAERVVAANGIEPVNFVLVAPAAKSVKVVGDFNNWGL